VEPALLISSARPVALRALIVLGEPATRFAAERRLRSDEQSALCTLDPEAFGPVPGA
jgi:HEAT repeat protein